MGVLMWIFGVSGSYVWQCDACLFLCVCWGGLKKKKQEWQVQIEEKEREKNDRSQVWNVNDIKFWCASVCESRFVFQSCLPRYVLTDNHTHSQMLRIFLRVCASMCLAPCLSLRTMIQSEISFHLLRFYRYLLLTHRDLGGGLIN